MDRRTFLQVGVAGPALAAGSAAVVLVRRERARQELAASLVDDAFLDLQAIELQQLKTFPSRGRDEFDRYFHGHCLNVPGLVDHLCSRDFSERLSRCRDRDEREACFFVSFCSRIATEAEILGRLEGFATIVGSDLDEAWAEYCGSLATRWNLRIAGLGDPLSPQTLSAGLGELVHSELARTARRFAEVDRRPAVGESVGKIGESALRLLPFARLLPGPAHPLLIPLFLVLAARPVWDFVAGLLHDPRDDYRAEISGRLALLGQRVGVEFEREVRERLQDLHAWQRRSVSAVASQVAEDRVGLL